MRFHTKVVAITGAAQGIGRQTAEQAAKEGATLLLIDRSRHVHELAATLTAEGVQVLALEADLEQWESTEQAFGAGVAHFGRIDVLINNVGGTIWARPFADYQPEQIEKEIRRSLFPTLWGCRAVLPWMLKQGAGSIVNVSSVATSGVNRVPYSAAKGGVNALTRSIAMEYSHQGIRINAVAPGGTEAPERVTPRNTETPTAQEKIWYQQVVDQTLDSSLMHRYGTLEEQAQAILFLASDQASYITGVTLPVAGGDLG
ncbi:1,6-dihydroxycyclohexa-2,4-diene-1-carboxylate dehydrogenase [Citrobacter sedlakii]|uniref:benzoate diol dehydrogenase BenD n=1 Tax=Citrobacter TaxID=544 RepID=UPI001969E761|nr:MULTISPECIES: benzoate diol dehydrogenase BenD [Citrobacter]EKX8504670.1 1,6-dihydroxycyclohexa-2,4-diene-1-carboxylate dehydrogenase [Citrobacter sedlakii]MBM9566713.1 1,6-dihydroxycyclohexa-2,4-diene-1-carboxylate dehydrogenase [Citrobacter sedlakii]HBL4689522.1 1,6-dihydroxycyclohexa-2,4-diene-1-carboxylate dehydrogenase [Citrobacter sedlakii]HBL4703961.1 1,6-dihydroxycyclohexa-2,4-diene-1-carboxylate dehydrogenase [Citrobacter sedlakii]HBL4718059.1 1,6-dihydroxycyclohexa-2,4-diene-1-car